MSKNTIFDIKLKNNRFLRKCSPEKDTINYFSKQNNYLSNNNNSLNSTEIYMFPHFIQLFKNKFEENKKNILYRKKSIILEENRYKISSFYNFIFILFIMYIKVLNAYQEINITITRTGSQITILSSNYMGIKPNQILINGIFQN